MLAKFNEQMEKVSAYWEINRNRGKLIEFFFTLLRTALSATVSEDAWIEPRTFAILASAVLALG